MSDIDQTIEVLTKRRYAIWTGEVEATPDEMPRITRKLADLYEMRRHERVRAASGKTRSEIVKRARVESELERLIKR